MCKNDRLKKEHIATFKTRWDNWRKLLETLVDANSGKLICPESRELIFVDQDEAKSVQVKIPYSICLYGIPLKLNSKGSEKIAVFIDGEYELEQDKEKNLRRVKSMVAFYGLTGKQKIKWSLLDAYHFDFFDSPANGHAPHPIFHAQRNIRCSDFEPRFNSALQNLPALEQLILGPTQSAEKDRLFKLGFFRIPTPQMDIFNLGVVVAADQLVGHNSEKNWGYFQSLLTTIHGKDGNIHHVKIPSSHKAKLYSQPRKNVPDWYLVR